MNQLGSCSKSNLSETMHFIELKDDEAETLLKPFHLELVFFPVDKAQPGTFSYFMAENCSH